MALFHNKQWEVTEYGLESCEPKVPYKYAIEAARLGKKTTRGNQTLYEWPVQLTEKSWVDIEAFIEAFKEALKLHAGKYGAPVDENILRESIEYARKGVTPD